MAGTRGAKTDPIESLKRYFDEQFTSLRADMATKSCINQLGKAISTQNEKIQILEDKVAVLESCIDQLAKNIEAQEQYNRRLCLRISGIKVPRSGKETAEECLKKVNAVFKELKVDIPDAVLDRAHRIGKPKMVGKMKVQQMIVRFTTWRHRTLVYRARKSSKKYKIHLDLTKPRLDMLIKANELLDENDEMFVFADVNCRLCAKTNEGFKYFETFGEFQEILRKEKPEESTNEEGSDEKDEEVESENAEDQSENELIEE